MVVNKPVFVMVTASTCGACQKFKESYWPELESILKNESRVNLVHVNVPVVGAPVGNEYHPELGSYIGWYPEFIIFTGDSWENHSRKLEGIIMSGKMVNGKPEFARDGTPMTAKGVLSWINKVISEMSPAGPGSSGNSDTYRVNTGVRVPRPKTPRPSNDTGSSNPIQSTGPAHMNKIGIQPPRHSAIQPPGSRRVIITESGRPLSYGAGSGQSAPFNSGSGSSGYISESGIRFRESIIDEDLY